MGRWQLLYFVVFVIHSSVVRCQRMCVCMWSVKVMLLGFGRSRDTARSVCQRPAGLQRPTANQPIRMGQDTEDLLQAKQLLHQNPTGRGNTERAFWVPWKCHIVDGLKFAVLNNNYISFCLNVFRKPTKEKTWQYTRVIYVFSRRCI